MNRRESRNSSFDLCLLVRDSRKSSPERCHTTATAMAATLMDATQPGKRNGCLCCAFLPDDLFLPEVLKGEVPTEEEEDELKHDDNEKTPTGTSDERDSAKCPREALNKIMAAVVPTAGGSVGTVMVDTHSHAQLERDPDEAYTVTTTDDESRLSHFQKQSLVSLACAVEEKDWLDTLRYAEASESVLPGIGVHPWYLADLSSMWLEDMEALLLQHPNAFVGEIGLCKMARFLRTYSEGKTAALELQRDVFKKQMALAARLHRPVSVHCVKQHGVFMKVLDELLDDDSIPPTIGMHSFTGTAHQVKDILNWEERHFPGQVVFYFGFSHMVNYAMCSSDKSRRKGREAVRAVPNNRLMAESDVHASADTAVGTAGAIAYIADCIGEPLVTVANITSRNGLAFLKSNITLH